MRIGEPPPSPGEPGAGNPRWLVPEDWPQADLVVWGAHGGAGTTTLATWLQPAWDMGAARPAMHPRYPVTMAAGRPLILACRMHGLVCASGDGRGRRGCQGGQLRHGAGDRQRWLARALGRDRAVPAARTPGCCGGPHPVRAGAAADRRPGQRRAATPGTARPRPDPGRDRRPETHPLTR